MRYSEIMTEGRGTARREIILLRCRSGLRLHTEGGEAYNRDMKRLVGQGLVKIERRREQSHNVSFLTLTDQGKEHLRQLGIDPEPPAVPDLPDDMSGDNFFKWRQAVRDAQSRR